MSQKKMMPRTPKPAPEKSPLERTADMMRRIIAAPKSEAIKPKRRKHR